MVALQAAAEAQAAKAKVEEVMALLSAEVLVIENEHERQLSVRPRWRR